MLTKPLKAQGIKGVDDPVLGYWGSCTASLLPILDLQAAKPGFNWFTSAETKIGCNAKERYAKELMVGEARVSGIVSMVSRGWHANGPCQLRLGRSAGFNP